MTASPGTVKAALLCGGMMLLGASAATAQAVGPVQPVSFEDPVAALQIGADRTTRAPIDVAVNTANEARFAPSQLDSNPEAERPRRLELELSAPAERTGMGFDVSVAQRASFGSNNDGDLDREGRASELRLGSGLGGEREPSDEPSIYLFAASEDEALTWQPGASRNSFGGEGSSFALQDRVEIGDMQAGVTYERGNIQASVAYVEREVSTRTFGTQSISQDESFTGFTLTMKR